MERKLKIRYYDTPDGQDYFKKLYFLARPAFEYGMFMAGTDAVAGARAVGWIPLVDRFFRVTSRPVITAFLFESTVYISTKLRKKDDEWNHVFGGLVCGYYWSRHIGFNPITIPLTLVACVSLAVWKHVKMEGFNAFYDDYLIRDEVETSAVARFNDWTWNKQLPRTWLTPEEAAAKGISINE